MRSHPDVVDVCIVGRPDREPGERVQAFLVVRRRLGVADLQAHLAGLNMAKYKWPEFVELVDEIPLLGAGKVDRLSLRALLPPPLAGGGGPPPGSPRNPRFSWVGAPEGAPPP